MKRQVMSSYEVPENPEKLDPGCSRGHQEAKETRISPRTKKEHKRKKKNKKVRKRNVAILFSSRGGAKKGRFWKKKKYS